MDGAIPTETPQGTRSRVAPRNAARDTPRARRSASSTAISRAVLAMRWPRMEAKTSPMPSGSTAPAAMSAGTRWSRSTSHAAALNSSE